MTNGIDLKQLYHATEEDMRFAIGSIAVAGQPPVPIIQIHYHDGSREKLEVVRESFKSGLILVSAERKPGLHHLYLGTRETIAIQQTEGEHRSILRVTSPCPALRVPSRIAHHRPTASR